ncbi:MAG: hypothetical protein FJ004_08895 [Chloroflexi bacterium]|nr:hypothetical protein [Chloroflexota bacterium]
MKVVLESVSGTGRANLERAKEEVNRVLNFRGQVVSAEAKGSEITVRFTINPNWDLPLFEKVSYLTAWIEAKVKSVFKVVSITLEEDEKVARARR